MQTLSKDGCGSYMLYMHILLERACHPCKQTVRMSKLERDTMIRVHLISNIGDLAVTHVPVEKSHDASM
jgi:hypothetical protein